MSLLHVIITISFLGTSFCEQSVHILAPFFYQVVSLILVNLWAFSPPKAKHSLTHTMILCFQTHHQLHLGNTLATSLLTYFTATLRTKAREAIPVPMAQTTVPKKHQISSDVSREAFPVMPERAPAELSSRKSKHAPKALFVMMDVLHLH